MENELHITKMESFGPGINTMKDETKARAKSTHVQSLGIFINKNTITMSEESSRFIGIYNYKKNDLPLTHMIAFEHTIEAVRVAIEEHVAAHQTQLSEYHIAEYVCDWNPNIISSPTKVQQFTLS